jgi:hypothetical protein
MTLPFDISNKNKRKYSCFVCGIIFKTFQEFKDHIVEEHEEGRDYIVCPLKRCQAPVRCIRSHFKVKHKNTPIPKIGMMKSIVWRDIAPKKKKKRKPKFREGYFQSQKMKKPLHYRSGYEKTIYECLDADVEVNAFNVEPFKVPYLHKGKEHKYIPDLIVQFIDGTTEVWEIKPSNQTLLEVNQNKWRAANKACKNRGWKFVVITEKGINLLKKKIKNQRNNL